MSIPQITIRLPPRLKIEFEAYANRLGLRSSELAKLLIARERLLRRLKSLHKKRKAPKRSRQERGSAVEMQKITAHVSTVDQVKEFDAYAASCSLNRNLAGAWLLEKELSEKWLRHALKIRRLRSRGR